ncbi:MAG: hypothetical protein GY863_08125 [bacterium]|nr:hypothetical protein [bacterium]
MKTPRIYVLFLLVSAMVLSFSDNEKLKLADLTGPYMGQTPPGDSPERFTPGVTADDLFSGSNYNFIKDGTECYFTRDMKIWHTKIENGKWIEPYLLKIEGVDVAFEHGVSHDGKTLYFDAMETLTEESKKVWAPMYRIVYRNNSWSRDPDFVGSGMFPSVTISGNIYTTIRIKGIATIAKYEMSEEGLTGPEPLDFSGNGENEDMHPCISPDESYVIFDTEGRPGREECGFFISFRNNDRSWTDPVNMYEVLKERHTSFARITSDGKYLIYTVYRKGQFWISTGSFDKLRN